MNFVVGDEKSADNAYMLFASAALALLLSQSQPTSIVKLLEPVRSLAVVSPLVSNQVSNQVSTLATPRRSPLQTRRGFFFRRSSYYSPYGNGYYNRYSYRDLTWADAIIFAVVALAGGLGRNYRAERVIEGERKLNPLLMPKVWNDQNGAEFYVTGHLPQGRFLYCLETTDGRHGNAITQRLRALDDEVTRLGLTFHKMILVSPHPESDTTAKRKSWMVRNQLDPRQWSFVTSTRDEIQRLIAAYGLTPSATRDVRVSLVDGRGFVLLSRPLHEAPLQQLAHEIIGASQLAFQEAEANRLRPTAKGTGSDGIPDPIGSDPYYDDEY